MNFHRENNDPSIKSLVCSALVILRQLYAFLQERNMHIFLNKHLFTKMAKKLVILVTLWKLLPSWTVNWQEDVEILQNLWRYEVHSSLNNSQDFGISFDNTPLFNVRGQNQYYNTSTKNMNMKWMNLTWKITSYILTGAKLLW